MLLEALWVPWWLYSCLEDSTSSIVVQWEQFWPHKNLFMLCVYHGASVDDSEDCTGTVVVLEVLWRIHWCCNECTDTVGSSVDAVVALWVL